MTSPDAPPPLYQIHQVDCLYRVVGMMLPPPYLPTNPPYLPSQPPPPHYHQVDCMYRVVGMPEAEVMAKRRALVELAEELNVKSVEAFRDMISSVT